MLTAVEQPDMLGSMSSALDMVLLAMLAIVGVYSIYTVIRLRRTYMLFPNKFLYPTGCTPETCIDEGGFIDYIIPRLTILGVACLVMALAYGVRVLLFPEVKSVVIELATVLLPAGILFWYALIQNKVSKTFW
jgi:hypothetical protein